VPRENFGIEIGFNGETGAEQEGAAERESLRFFRADLDDADEWQG
jgi:hypothetical protein